MSELVGLRRQEGSASLDAGRSGMSPSGVPLVLVDPCNHPLTPADSLIPHPPSGGQPQSPADWLSRATLTATVPDGGALGWASMDEAPSVRPFPDTCVRDVQSS